MQEPFNVSSIGKGGEQNMSEETSDTRKPEWKAAKTMADERMEGGNTSAKLLTFVVDMIVLLVILCICLLASSSLNVLLVILIAAAFGIFLLLFLSGYTLYLMKTARGQPDAGFSDLNYGFDRMAGALISLFLQLFVRIFLWSLLFLIPGIVAVYRYRFSLFILIDHPGLPASTAIRLSSEMTRGRKGGLFVLDLSFLKLYIVSFLMLLMAVVCILTGIDGGLSGGSLVFIILMFLMFLILGMFFLTSAQASRRISCVCFYDSARNDSRPGDDQAADAGQDPGEDAGSRRKKQYRDDPWD